MILGSLASLLVVPLSCLARRVPTSVGPCDLGEETAILGAMLVDRGADEATLAAVDPRDFSSSANQIIFAAIGALHAEGCPIDVVTVWAWLGQRGLQQQIGGANYLAELVDSPVRIGQS